MTGTDVGREEAIFTEKIIEWAKELQSLAQAGLFYGHDDFDKERYQRIRDISAEMMSERTGIPVDKVRGLFCGDVGYQTPKIDTRAAIIDHGKILLVRERSGKWSMPGGWCEYALSPAENAVKEVKEEAGLDTAVEKLIAVQDRDKHNRPPYAYKVIKFFFACRVIGGSFAQNIETVGSGYFAPDELPELATEKCNEEQIRMCFEAAGNGSWQTVYE